MFRLPQPMIIFYLHLIFKLQFALNPDPHGKSTPAEFPATLEGPSGLGYTSPSLPFVFLPSGFLDRCPDPL